MCQARSPAIDLRKKVNNTLRPYISSKDLNAQQGRRQVSSPEGEKPEAEKAKTSLFGRGGLLQLSVDFRALQCAHSYIYTPEMSYAYLFKFIVIGDAGVVHCQFHYLKSCLDLPLFRVFSSFPVNLFIIITYFVVW